jgi:hypothetical protein
MVPEVVERVERATSLSIVIALAVMAGWERVEPVMAVAVRVAVVTVEEERE